MARSAAHGSTFVLVTAVLLGALTACGAAGGGGAAPEEEGPSPCPSSSTTPPAASATPTPSPAPTGSPGDSRTHPVDPDPERNCLIESGIPDMPVDP
ncbi:hypothetical protein ACFY7C_29145 [Streptomyces sp. NPDC012769]|uniref:hypothetical protein n=1 Tax=Streptomyces sp. NPDC012769 TaxID=3364848 RepID=UPI0036991653